MSGSASFSWIGTASGDWNDPANWADVTTGQTPAVVVPGSLDAVAFNNGGFTGNGAAGTVTFLGTDTVSGTLNAGTLVAQGHDVSIVSGATASVGTVLDNGEIQVNGTNAVLLAGSIVTGNNFTLNVQNGGLVETGNLTVQGGDTFGDIDIDATSIVEVGQAGTGATGDLTVDQGHTLWVNNGALYNNIIDNGLISASGLFLGFIAVNFIGQPGRWTTNGKALNHLGGTGTVEVQAGGSAEMDANVVQAGLTFQIDSGAYLAVLGPIVAGNMIDFDGNDDTLSFNLGLYDPYEPPSVGAVINGFNASDTIIVAGSGYSGIYDTPFTTATYVDGVLNMLNGTIVVASLTLAGSFSGDRFDVIPLPSNGNAVTGGGEVVLDAAYGESPSAGTGTQDIYAWIGGAGVEDWNNPGNWEDVTQGQTPAVVAPGSLDIASVSNTMLIGNGDAASLTLDGQDNVLGNIDSSEMLVAGTVVVASGATELAATLQVGSGSSAASLTVLNGGSVIAGTLVLGSSITNQVSVDGTLVIDVGTGTSASAGALTIDPGFSMSGEGSVLGYLIDNGLVQSTSLTIGQSGPYGGAGLPGFLAPLSGTGTVDVEANGTISLAAPVNSSGLTFELDGSADLDVAAPIAAGNTIEMNGSGNTLTIDGRYDGSYAGLLPSIGATIVGFDASDTLIIAALYAPFSVTAAVYNGGTLDLLSGTVVADSLDLPEFPDAWAVTPLSQGAEAVTVACFTAGTRIATSGGPIPIECLRQGDTVLTASGRAQKIKWISRRRINCRRHPAPAQVMPVRIAPHAFGKYLPQRALLLSPDHAVFVDDVLIPVKYLINGTTITRLDVATITYYHLELPRHDVVLAEGLPAESYLETGGRSNFEDGGSAMRLYPDFGADPYFRAAIWEYAGYAPLIVAGDVCERVRARLAVRAAMLGYQIASKEVFHADKGQMHAEHADSSDGRPEPSACFA